ncbi:hypothetical protein FDECE_1328 [Fusarium decemcellulare]|nr:hypothetical protein FDECE_1328 [Fusarium decemcellulare]
MGTSEDGKKHRRPHRKSRLGCQECKRRKIKCDESLPVCLNCVQRGAECSYMNHAQRTLHQEVSDFFARNAAGSPGSDDSQQSLQSTLINQKKQLDAMSKRLEALEDEVRQLREAQNTAFLCQGEVELLRHYLHMTASKTQHHDSGHKFWRVALLEIGLKQPHVLHLILGFAALHKSRTDPDQQTALLDKASHYHTLGLQESTRLLQSINQENCQVIHASAVLISLHNLARGPQPGQYIGFSDHGGPTFMTFIRGMKLIREHANYDNDDTDAIEAERTDSEGVLGAQEILPCQRTEHETQLHILRDSIKGNQNLTEPDVKDSYLTVVDQLEPFLESVYNKKDVSTNRQRSDPGAYQPLGWLYRAPELYLDYLERKENLALVIFAYFALILKKLGFDWPLEGWPEHIMSGIWNSIHPTHRELIQWPQKQIGWEPDATVPIDTC